MTSLTLNLNPIIKLTREQFYQLCETNPQLKLERNALRCRKFGDDNLVQACRGKGK